MKKILVQIASCLCILVFTGCTSQSVNDIYETKYTQGYETQENSKDYNEKKITLSYQPIVNEVFYIEEGDTADIDSKNSRYSVMVEETKVVDNISDLTEMMDSEKADKIKYWYENIDNNGKIDSDGNLNKDRRGVDRMFLLVKISVSNTSDSKEVFNSANFRIFNINRDENQYYVLSEGFEFMDKADEETIARNHLTLQAGETKEVVMGAVIPKEILLEYTQINEDESVSYKDVITKESSLKELYMYYIVSGNMFPKGTNVFKLNAE